MHFWHRMSPLSHAHSLISHTIFWIRCKKCLNHIINVAAPKCANICQFFTTHFWSKHNGKSVPLYFHAGDIVMWQELMGNTQCSICSSAYTLYNRVAVYCHHHKCVLYARKEWTPKMLIQRTVYPYGRHLALPYTKPVTHWTVLGNMAWTTRWRKQGKRIKGDYYKSLVTWHYNGVNGNTGAKLTGSTGQGTLRCQVGWGVNNLRVIPLVCLKSFPNTAKQPGIRAQESLSQYPCPRRAWGFQDPSVTKRQLSHTHRPLKTSKVKFGFMNHFYKGLYNIKPECGDLSHDPQRSQHGSGLAQNLWLSQKSDIWQAQRWILPDLIITTSLSECPLIHCWMNTGCVSTRSI